MDCSICNKNIKQPTKWNLYIHDTLSDRHKKYLQLFKCPSCNNGNWKDERISGQTHKLTCKNDGHVKLVVPKNSSLTQEVQH